MNIRRNFPNYELPSEAEKIFSNMIGKKISSIYLGTFKSSFDVQENFDPFGKPLGGPVFISLPDKTTAFNYDDILDSIVLKEVEMDINHPDFLSQLYNDDDYVPFFLKVKTMVRVNAFDGDMIKALKTYRYDIKHPEITRYKQFHELAISIELSNGEIFLIESGLSKTKEGISTELSKFSKLRNGVKKRLTCISVY